MNKLLNKIEENICPCCCKSYSRETGRLKLNNSDIKVENGCYHSCCVPCLRLLKRSGGRHTCLISKCVGNIAELVNSVDD